MPSPVLKRVPGEIGARLSAPWPQMLHQHFAVAGKAAGRQHHGAGPIASDRANLGAHLDALDGAIVRYEQPLRPAMVAHEYPCVACRALQLAQHRSAAADGLDAGWPGAQVVDRLGRRRYRGP